MSEIRTSGFQQERSKCYHEQERLLPELNNYSIFAIILFYFSSGDQRLSSKTQKEASDLILLQPHTRFKVKAFSLLKVKRFVL